MPRLRARRRKLSPLPRGNLQDRAGAAVGDDAARGNRAPNAEDPFPFTEEIEVEREAHAEGVDAGAARDEETDTCVGAIETGEPEQAGAEPSGDRNLQAKHDRDREAPQARCELRFRHSRSRGRKEDLSP